MIKTRDKKTRILLRDSVFQFPIERRFLRVFAVKCTLFRDVGIFNRYNYKRVELKLEQETRLGYI